MDSRYKINKTRCSICGRTVKKVLPKHKKFNTYDFWQADDGSAICKRCESNYHVLDDYSCRGYGYKYSTEPRMTTMDTGSTPTFGIELEVAGNIKNIDKIQKLTGPTHECSIGYDTSVEGAQFELSYCPGTYYWYLYESKLQAVCQLLQKDKWTMQSKTIGTHIHVGGIDARNYRGYLRVEATRNIYFWLMMEVIGERSMNKYCAPQFTNDHHDAISYSRWGTLEFRFFSGTYDFYKIMQRIRFLRQLIDNSDRNGVNWKKFKPEIKDWMKNIIANSQLIENEDERQDLYKILDGEFDFKILSQEEKERILLSNNVGIPHEVFWGDGEDGDEEENQEEIW